MNRVLKFAFGLAATITLSSCASVSVQNEASSATLQMPQRIYVEAFSTTNGKFKVDREDAELADFKQNLQSMMQAASVKDLSQRLIPAMPASEQQNFSPENAWVIRGEFTRVNQGSRLLRGVVGFGAGGTKVETNVAVYDLNRNSNVPFLTFSTTGGSNAEPGAVTGGATDPVVAAVGIAASGAGGIAHGLTEDTSRTAREITAELSDYMYRNGWISKDKWIQPKEVKP